jgi:hypothetical protein
MAKRAKQEKKAKKLQVGAFELMLAAIVVVLITTMLWTPARTVVLLHVIALYLQIIAFIVIFAFKWGIKYIKSVLALFFSFFYVVLYLFFTSRYSFSGGIPNAFVFVALLSAAVITVALMIAAASTLWRGRKWMGRIGYGLLILVVAFAVILCSITHLNYALGDDTPQVWSAQIEDKDYHRRRKGPDCYEFIMTIDGETIDVEVTVAEYYDYEVGDTYTVYRYEGAFGKPFYLAE